MGVYHVVDSGNYQFNPVNVETNMFRLHSYRDNFEDGWGGAGTYAFNRSFIEEIIAIVADLHPQPLVFPMYDGGIQLEWEKNDGDYLELELHETDTEYRFMRMTPEDRNNPNSKEIENYFTVPKNTDSINKVVREFYEKEIESARRAAHLLGKEDFMALLEFAHMFNNGFDKTCEYSSRLEEFDRWFPPRKVVEDGH